MTYCQLLFYRYLTTGIILKLTRTFNVHNVYEGVREGQGMHNVTRDYVTQKGGGMEWRKER